MNLVLPSHPASWLHRQAAVRGLRNGKVDAADTKADDELPVSTVLIDSHRVGVWRFGAAGGWPLIWNHGGLSCGLDATVICAAARQRGANIIAIDRPGVGRSDAWSMSSITSWIIEVIHEYLVGMS